MPENPKLTRSGFPHSPAKHRAIGIEGPVWREVLFSVVQTQPGEVAVPGVGTDAVHQHYAAA